MNKCTYQPDHTIKYLKLKYGNGQNILHCLFVDIFRKNIEWELVSKLQTDSAL